MRNRLDVVQTVRTIAPNTWGIVFVSQSATTDATLSADGTVQIGTPPIKDGAGTSGPDKLAPSGVAAPTEQPPVCSWHLVAPRKPGRSS